MHTLYSLNEVIPRGMINTAHKNYKNKSPSANMRNLSSWPRVQETPKTPQYIVVWLPPKVGSKPQLLKTAWVLDIELKGFEREVTRKPLS